VIGSIFISRESVVAEQRIVTCLLQCRSAKCWQFHSTKPSIHVPKFSVRFWPCSNAGARHPRPRNVWDSLLFKIYTASLSQIRSATRYIIVIIIMIMIMIIIILLFLEKTGLSGQEKEIRTTRFSPGKADGS
jgi:hypothetical protein